MLMSGALMRPWAPVSEPEPSLSLELWASSPCWRQWGGEACMARGARRPPQEQPPTPAVDTGLEAVWARTGVHPDQARAYTGDLSWPWGRC